MNRRSFVVAGVAALVAGPAGVRSQGVVVCPKCGREAKPGETACSHCGAALPPPKAAAPAAEPEAPKADKAAEVARLALVTVADSLRQARELEEKQPEVALGYYQNALALMRLAPEGKQPAGVGKAIVDGNDRTMQTLLLGRVTCRKCNGTGKYQMDLGKVDRTRGTKEIEGVACPACKGAGSFAGYRDVSKAKMAILQGRREFERRQMVAGDVRVGLALVPAALEALLSNRQRALVMTGMPMPCPACQLTGRQSCSTCKGTGWVKCTYEGCDNGEVKEARKTETVKSKRLNDEVKKKCPRCGGMGEIPCETCKGAASVACKTCNGSGQAPRCKRCSGSGLVACTKCKGTGEVKGGVCPDCKGEGMVLCSACQGEGAVGR